MNCNQKEIREGGSERLGNRRCFRPEIDIVEREDAFVVLADVPGSSPEEIGVSLENNQLSISAKVSDRFPKDKARFALHEFDVGDYLCNFEMHEPVDESKISAEYRNGVLRVTIPKSEARRPRKIAVKAMQ